MTDPWDDPGAQEWLQQCRDELIPKLRESAMTVSLVPKGDSDIKFAVELGMSIMMDKPILAVVQPGTQVPDHLVRVADEIIEADPMNPDQIARVIQQTIKRIYWDEGSSDAGILPAGSVWDQARETPRSRKGE